MRERYLPPNGTGRRAFDLDRALANWRVRYPDKMERIQALRLALYNCRRERTGRTFRGRNERVSFPATAHNIELMLLAEGVGLS